MSPKEPEAIVNWYDALSASYDDVYGDEQDKKHRRIVETLNDRKFERFVDVGCGTGRLLRIVSSNSRVSIGVDISRQMLIKAKQTICDSSAQLVRAEASHLPLRDQVADGVVSVSVSEVGELFSKQFQELSRIAAKEAVISMTVFSGKNVVLHDELTGKGMDFVASLTDREQLWTRRPNSR